MTMRWPAFDLSPDVGTRVSYALTEARTVQSRAETAIASLVYWNEHHPDYEDPDTDAIIAALELAATALAPFQRTGKSRS